MADREGSSRYMVAARSYGEVLRHLEHEDAKAGRLVTSMAFLTAAAAAVLAARLQWFDSRPAVTWEIAGRSFDLAVTAFCIFVVLVGAGTAAMLAALGPSFNLLHEWKGPGDKAWDSKSSLIFARSIQQHSIDAWRRHLIDTKEPDLEHELTLNFITESFLLAQKADHKVVLIGAGSLAYRWSLYPLAVFLMHAFIDTGGLAMSASFVLLGLLALGGGAAWLDHPDDFERSRWGKLWTSGTWTLQHLVPVVAGALMLVAGVVWFGMSW